MRSTNAPHAARRLLELAHDCISGVLQFDYLSSGIGHKKSTTLPNTESDKSGVGNYVAAINSRRIDGVRSPFPTASDTVVGAARSDIVQRYLSDVSRRRRLSSSEEYRLARAAGDGDVTARRELIEHQLGLVVMMARPFRNQGLPLLDLVEEGNLGLMKAIEKFDPELGYRFSTYAKWWIRQSMQLAVMTQTRVVHVPVHMTRALKRQRKEDASEEPKSRPAASSEQNLPDEASKMLLYDINDQRHAASETNDAAVTLMDTLAAPEEEEPEGRMQRAGQRRCLQTALGRLSDNEQIVIQSRFGLDNGVPRTLDSIARDLSLSSERVRQIQSEALTKLRCILVAGQGLERDGLL